MKPLPFKVSPEYHNPKTPPLNSHTISMLDCKDWEIVLRVYAGHPSLALILAGIIGLKLATPG